MRYCDRHWGMLRDAIKGRGLEPLVARGGTDAARRAAEEIEGTATDATYDPLMAAHWMTINRALGAGGLYLLSGDYCPVCEAVKNTPVGDDGGYADAEDVERDWTEGPADAALEYVKGSEVLCAALGWPWEAQRPEEGE